MGQHASVHLRRPSDRQTHSWRLRFALAWALGPACACAVTPESQRSGPPPEAARWYDAIAWDAATAELAQVLSAYLQLDTSNPPGNELVGARFLADVLAKDGVPSELVMLGPGRASLVARLRAASPRLAPVCLLSHLDVVPADPAQWSADAPPFSGRIDAGYVHGRGALDMKGAGVAQLFTLAWLQRLHVPLQRDVVLLAVADEEVDNAGIRQLLDERWSELGCAEAVTEGGLGVTDLLLPGQSTFTLAVAEKGAVWVRLVARGRGGHGSTSAGDSALDSLLAAVARVRERRPPPRMHAALYELLAAAGKEVGGLRGVVLQRPALVDAWVTGRLMEEPVARAALTDTCNVTGMGTGAHEPNVVALTAWAIADCRVLPGTRSADLLNELRVLLADLPVELEVLQAREASQSTWDGPLAAALARHAVQGVPRAAVGPSIFVGSSDASYLREHGVLVYGFTPFVVGLDELRSMHGTHERVSIENLRRALRTFFRATVDVAVAPSAPSP